MNQTETALGPCNLDWCRPPYFIPSYTPRDPPPSSYTPRDPSYLLSSRPPPPSSYYDDYFDKFENEVRLYQGFYVSRHYGHIPFGPMLEPELVTDIAQEAVEQHNNGMAAYRKEGEETEWDTHFIWKTMGLTPDKAPQCGPVKLKKLVNANGIFTCRNTILFMTLECEDAKIGGGGIKTYQTVFFILRGKPGMVKLFRLKPDAAHGETSAEGRSITANSEQGESKMSSDGMEIGANMQDVIEGESKMGSDGTEIGANMQDVIDGESKMSSDGMEIGANMQDMIRG